MEREGGTRGGYVVRVGREWVTGGRGGGEWKGYWGDQGGLQNLTATCMPAKRRPGACPGLVIVILRCAGSGGGKKSTNCQTWRV